MGSTTGYVTAAATPALITALRALDRDDPIGARRAVHAAAGTVGVEPLCHRLAVAARALAADAGLLAADDRTLVRLLPEIAGWSLQVDSAAIDQIPRHLAAWRTSDDPRTTCTPSSETALSLLVLVGFLCSRLGYPAEVVA